MKWLTNKYAYTLVALAMLTCIVLQLAWLLQLFHAQQVQVRRDLDQAVSDAARMSDYLSVVKGHEKSENFRHLFLSTEWLQIKQAFTRMRNLNLGSSFSTEIKADSTFVSIGIQIANDKRKHSNRRAVYILDKGQTMQSVIAADKRDLQRMDSLVKDACLKAQLDMHSYYIIYDYDTGKPETPRTWESSKKADYRSQQFGYNLNAFLHTYQLVVPSINELVLSRMRYYLISSFLMLLVTGLAFVLLFKTIRSQRMYAQARIAFTGNMTHELKTPVSVIEAALDAITRYQLFQQPAKLETYIDISRSELQRLTLMIDKVLNLDQLDHGKVDLRKELYDVQQGLDSVISSMRLRIANGALIQYHPAEEPCFVQGDPVHLTNVFYNLVDNALKYSGDHAVINIVCNCAAEKVRISVSDNGPGIQKIYNDRIFERFFRISDNPDIHNVKGSGLGLYYVKQIIEQHGGSIQVQSEMEKGTNFIIELPAYHEA